MEMPHYEYMTDFHITFDFDLIFMFNVYLRSFKTYSHNIWYADASLGVHVSVAYMPFDLRIIFVVK